MEHIVHGLGWFVVSVIFFLIGTSKPSHIFADGIFMWISLILFSVAILTFFGVLP